GSLDCHRSLGGLGALDCHRSLGGLGALGGGRGLGTGFAGLALVGLAAAAAGGDDPPGPGLARRLPDRHPRLLGDLVVAGDLVGEDVALVDPHLHADAPEGRARLAEAVVDVGPQRVQRHPTFAVPLATRHLRAAEAPGALHADPLSARLLRRLHGPLHGPAKADPARELVAHGLGNESGIELGLLDLLDVQLDLDVVGDLGQVGAQPVGLGAPASDHDARPCGVDVDTQAVARALHLDAADGGALELAHQVVAD